MNKLCHLQSNLPIPKPKLGQQIWKFYFEATDRKTSCFEIGIDSTNACKLVKLITSYFHLPLVVTFPLNISKDFVTKRFCWSGNWNQYMSLCKSIVRCAIQDEKWLIVLYRKYFGLLLNAAGFIGDQYSHLATDGALLHYIITEAWMPW